MMKKILFLASFSPLIVVATGLLIASLPGNSEAQSQVQRDEQRIERQKAREIKQGGREVAQHGKQVCREGDDSRADCRQLKRGFKQETREGARNVRR